MSDADFVATFLGPFGKWQLRSTLLVFLVKIPSAWFMACLIFTAKSPLPGEIFCRPDTTVDSPNFWIQSAHPKRFNRVENEESYNFCDVYEDASNSTGDLIPCHQFEVRPRYESIITQYQLFCHREALVSLTQSFHLLGVLVGGIIAYYMLKVISPRQTMLAGMISQIFLGLATGFAPTYELHLFFRCAVAASCSLQCIGIMILSDIISSARHRVTVVCLFEQFWSIGVILLPLMSTWWSSWSLVYVAITLPTFSLIILHYWIPDSPRWLLRHGKVDEAKCVLLKAASVNGKTDFEEDELNKQLHALADSMKEDPPDAKWISIWSGHEGVKRKLFAAHLGWSIYLMLYFGLLLHVRAMGRDYLEVNTIIAGISELLGTFIGWQLILKSTHKWFWTSMLNVFTSLIALSAIFVPDSVPPFQRMMIYMATSMICKMSVSTSLSIFITSMSEIVTKDKRKICNYSGVTCSRTLVMIAPFIGFCVIFGQLVPQIIMSFMNIFAAILVASCITTPRTLPKKAKFSPTEIQIADSCLKNENKTYL